MMFISGLSKFFWTILCPFELDVWFIAYAIILTIEIILVYLIRMKIVTGYIYYFLLAIIALTCTLLIFVFRPLRRLLHKIQFKYNKIFNNQILNGIVYFSFAIILIILLESLYSFKQVHSHLSSRTYLLIKKIISLKKASYKSLILLEDTTDTGTLWRTQSWRLKNTESITCLKEILCSHHLHSSPTSYSIEYSRAFSN